jgi:prepilin-type N-terminal cleavage/methylation domain-containing protein
MRWNGRENEQGFTMVETVVVVALISVVVCMAIISSGIGNMNSQADKAMGYVNGQLRVARGMAISQRRNIQVAFNGTNHVLLTRQEVGGGQTPFLDNPADVNGIPWEGPAVYAVVVSTDTPMAFGNGAAIKFVNASTGGVPGPTMMFNTAGQFVDNTGAPLNGTVFMGIVGRPNTARSVTVLGATGRVRSYHWLGTGCGLANCWIE